MDMDAMSQCSVLFIKVTEPCCCLENCTIKYKTKFAKMLTFSLKRVL